MMFSGLFFDSMKINSVKSQDGWMVTATPFLEGMLSLEKLNGYKNYISTAKERNNRTEEIHGRVYAMTKDSNTIKMQRENILHANF